MACGVYVNRLKNNASRYSVGHWNLAMQILAHLSPPPPIGVMLWGFIPVTVIFLSFWYLMHIRCAPAGSFWQQKLLDSIPDRAHHKSASLVSFQCPLVTFLFTDTARPTSSDSSWHYLSIFNLTISSFQFSRPASILSLQLVHVAELPFLQQRLQC